MSADPALLPLLPEALQRPSPWSWWLRWRAGRAGADLSRAILGAGRPWPLVKNEGGSLDLGRVFLAAGSRLWAHRGGALSLGDGTVLDAGAEIVAWTQVRIGRGCYLGWDALVMDTDLHGLDGRPLANRPVAIGDGVRIGARAMILKGVTIGDGAIVRPGAIVTRDVPAGAEVGPPTASLRAPTATREPERSRP